jgi:hypothetical protein
MRHVALHLNASPAMTSERKRPFKNLRLMQYILAKLRWYQAWSSRQAAGLAEGAPLNIALRS